MKTASKVPPIGGYYGGKASMVKTITSFINAHCPLEVDTLVSPFAGFASVELSLDIPHKELFDINPNTVAALTAIRDNPEWLIETLMVAPWGRDFFHRCQKGQCNPAIAAIAYSAMAHHRGGSVSGFSQQQCDRAVRRNWSYLLKVSEALQSVDVYCMDFRQSMLWNCDALLYLDPPYLDGGQYYQHAMSEGDHIDMLTLANRHIGPVAISGYDSELYTERLAGWRRVEFKAQNAHRKTKTEVLWMNY